MPQIQSSLCASDPFKPRKSICWVSIKAQAQQRNPPQLSCIALRDLFSNSIPFSVKMQPPNASSNQVQCWKQIFVCEIAPNPKRLMRIFLILMNLLLYNVKEIPVSVSTGTSGRKLGTGGRIGGSMRCQVSGIVQFKLCLRRALTM